MRLVLSLHDCIAPYDAYSARLLLYGGRGRCADVAGQVGKAQRKSRRGREASRQWQRVAKRNTWAPECRHVGITARVQHAIAPTPRLFCQRRPISCHAPYCSDASSSTGRALRCRSSNVQSLSPVQIPRARSATQTIWRGWSLQQSCASSFRSYHWFRWRRQGLRKSAHVVLLSFRY